MSVPLRRSAIWLTTVFLLSLAVNLLILGILSHAMNDTQSETILATVLKIHAVPLGALLVGVFSRQKSDGQMGVSISIVSLIIAILWAFIMTYSWWGFPDTIVAPDVNNRYLNHSSDLSFLLVAMIGYFTGKASDSAPNT
jgi:hypothetical protein